MNARDGLLDFIARGREQLGGHSFAEQRAIYDTYVIHLYLDEPLRRFVRGQSKTNLGLVWDETVRRLGRKDLTSTRMLEPLQIHERIVAGLPGEALFLASAMAFDTMNEALQLFDVSMKTAKLRIGDRLSPGESEMAVRIGRVLTMARELFGSMEAARQYLRSANFALGGAMPRDLLRTAEGEQLVLSELQTQAGGGPV